MTRTRALDLGALLLGAGLLLRAAVVGGPRLNVLLWPGPGDLHEAAHSRVACFAWVATVCLLPVLTSRRAGPRLALLRRLRAHPVALVGLHLSMLIVLTTALAPLLTALAPGRTTYPTGLPPSPGHWFGTTAIGTDVFTDTLYGARVSLLVGVVAVAVSTTLGTAIGAIGGYLGGWPSRVLGGFTDLMLAIPRIAVLLLVVGLVPMGNARFLIVALVLGLTGWMHVARTVRMEVLSVRERDFVIAARALGVPEARILARHVLPNVLTPVVIYAALGLGGTMLTEAALAYLGRGASAGASWGSLIHEGSSRLATEPWSAGIPGLCLMASVVAFNLVGDGLRDALDPRLRVNPS
ncbi:peptide ABC transporter permease [Deltaproteobacteria bacterium]|nr:peptide ABC transporter permease [Deltaproteobacteria bacterium]